MDYRIILAQFPTSKAATRIAKDLTSTFAAHLAAVKRSKRYRGELTEPWLALARQEGFSWDDDDVFTWDDSDEDPQLVIGHVGKLLVVYHAAALQLAANGLQAFARKRGATEVTFWDPDPTPGTVTLKVTQAEGFERALDDACAAHGVELELADDESQMTGGGARLVVKEGRRSRYAELFRSWGVGGLLLDLGKRPGLEISLKVAEPPPPRQRATSELPASTRVDLIGQVTGIMRAIRRGELASPTLEDCVRAAVALNGDEDLPLIFQMNMETAVDPLTDKQLRSVAGETELRRRLALASPMSQREAATMAMDHLRWLKERATIPPVWRTVPFLDLELTLYDGDRAYQAQFARRDIRGLALGDRNLAGANFSGALADRTDFTGADLSGATFVGASLRGAKLVGARLAGADLRGADLREAELAGASLEAANLAGAQR